jgi:hypothetical protein
MASDDESARNVSTEWAFVSNHIDGSDADSDGNFRYDTMLCFSKHGTLALTFHARFMSGIVCAKCFQFLKPGSYAIHSAKCDKDPAPSATDIKKWADTDSKWANLRRNYSNQFSDKTVIKQAIRNGVGAYVVHPRFYLGKTSSTMKIKAMCITDGCVHVCAFNALQRHIKKAHMSVDYLLYNMDIVVAPTVNDVEDDDDGVEREESAGNTEDDCDEEAVTGKRIVGGECEEDGTEDDNNTIGKLAEEEEEESKKEEEKLAAEETPAYSQDEECETFVKEDGPSDDDTAEENHEKDVGQGGKGKKKPGANQNNPAPVRKSARKRRAPARY